MELVGPAIDIAKCCAPYIRKKTDLVFYRKNVQNLKHQMDKLVEKKAEILERLDLAEKQHLHKPKPHVAEWMNKVQILERETSSINWEEGNQKCFIGLCVNWVNRYRMNQEVQQKDYEVRNLIEEVQRFEALEISTPPLAPPVEQMNIYGYMETDSSEFLIQKISDLVSSKDVKAIGLWGMGGVGKTIFVRRLNNHLKSNSIFDKVIMVTISQTPDWKQIHKHIAERIGLDVIDYESEDMRLNMLSMALKKEKYLLFIVDDVWAYFHLSLLGISDEASDAKCKFILTTRYQSVCAQMGVNEREQFELKPMSKDDSWKLFQAKAGSVVNLAALQPIAIELCLKCGGSPLAICTFASTLRGDTKVVSWNGALRALSSSDQTHLSDIFMPVFTSIGFSFDRLRSEAVKLCFLYCCSFPEDYKIDIDDMLSYGIGLNMIKERSLKEARERVEIFVKELKESSLLMVVEEDNQVHVHDIVRQVGIWIASKRDYGFAVKCCQQLDELRNDKTLQYSKHITVADSKINKLPSTLCCPSLLALDMSDIWYDQEFEMNNEFFVQTKNLQFLDISRIGISKIPNSICSLINLCTLDMRGLENLSDISSLGKLESLEILILDDTGIEELPNELGNLVTLRMLHLKNTRKLKSVAPDIFRRLRGLQELNMENSFNGWELKNGVNASLSEIFGLSQLTTLHMDIINPLCLQQSYMCASLSNLEKFSIVVATSRDSIKTERRFMRYLRLANIPLGFGNWICKLFEICEYVKLNGSDVAATFPFRQIMDFNCLTFPYLEQLVLEDMDNLESVCNSGSLRVVFFSNLTHIHIGNCKNLNILFKGSMDQALQNLAVIEIRGCDKLKALTHVDGPSYFQKLKKIHVHDCGNLEIMFAAEADWDCLETICVTRCRNLLNIFHKSPFPENLKHLTIKNCENLTSSVSSLTERSFSSIETIKVAHCNPGNVEYLLRTNEIDEPSNKNVFENLKVLSVVDFDGKGIFHGPVSKFSLQNLVEVIIEGCINLTSIWYSCETFALLKPLNAFLIERCDKLILKEVFLPKGMDDEFALRVEKLNLVEISQLTTLAWFPQASLQYVKVLHISSCENLKYLLPHQGARILNNLNELQIKDCCNLENIRQDVAHNNLICMGRTSSSMTNITKLWIENCSRLDLEKLELTSLRTRELTLKRLPQLETLSQLQNSYIVGQQCDTIQVLECENFEKLYSSEDAFIFNGSENGLAIYDCPKLLPFINEEEIVPSPSNQRQGWLEPIESAFLRSTFKNLKLLLIGDCHNLKNIFSVSIARSLVSLTDIIVVNCHKLTEIVVLSDSVKNEIVYADLFPCLRIINLFWLPNLECFFRGKPTSLMLESLEFVYVWESPNLTTLGMGPSSAPNLKQINGKEEWFHSFEKESSFYSRLSSLFWVFPYSFAHQLCSVYDSWIACTAYTSKLQESQYSLISFFMTE